MELTAEFDAKRLDLDEEMHEDEPELNFRSGKEA